jgi:potassium/sodium efflux P-type ATPase
MAEPAQTPLAAPAHTLQTDDIIAAFGTDIDHGLTDDQAKEAEAKYGLNKLKEVPPPSFLSILLRNSLNAMTIVLIAAMAVSFGTQDFISGGVIAALVVVNVGVGTVNEYKAEMTVAALEAIGSPTAAVLRRSSPSGPGELRTIKSELVMPGDIVMVKIGDIVPADCRILPGHLAGLECDEALLTGESLPSVKTEEVIDDPVCPVGDRTCMIYSGSQAVKGRAKVICVSTGMTTELGKISAAMSKKESSGKTGFAATWHKVKGFLGVVDTTPLQIKLNKLAYLILFFACICAVIVVASTGFRDVPLTIATYAVAAAVSLLPASLPAVIALSLATASRKLAQSNALVRRMDATETLGAVTDVCSDKTGTITLGKMVTR